MSKLSFERLLFWTVRISAVFLPLTVAAGIFAGRLFAFSGIGTVFGYYFLVELILWTSGIGTGTDGQTEFAHVHPDRPNWSDTFGVGIYGILQVIIFPLALLYLSYRVQDLTTLVGGVLSLAVMAGSVGGLAGHEYIHRKKNWEKRLGILIFGVVNYAHFYVSHLRGHHVAIGLENDWSTSKKGENAFAFLWRAQIHGYFGAWRLEAERMKRLKRPVFSTQNFMIKVSCIQIAFLSILVLSFNLKVVVLYLLTSFMSSSLMEMVNYLSHYGLVRKSDQDGNLERIQNKHSWESNNKVTNWFIFNAGKHCHHHKNSYEPHYKLRLAQVSPYLPYGLPLMTIIAFIPPLYFKIMNPLLEKNLGNVETLESELIFPKGAES